MTRITQFTVGLAILLAIIQTAYASFGLCIADNYYFRSNKNIVGFQLWNDQGEFGTEYRTIQTAGKTDLANGKWNVHLVFLQATNPWSYVERVDVSHSDYGNFGQIPMNLICLKETGDRRYRVHYACFDDNDEGYCTQERIERESTLCRSEYRMGNDSDKC
ncbi:hypothetical protein BGZ76_007722 [Entomortierella beljakovae]|nr:hypothetical protein BGZ76_007722 [Entomortierella beljakovae]